MPHLPEPIRVGILGLSATGSWSVASHLPALLSLPESYIIVAVCNSSEASSQAAIEAHRLPATTKAYGSPEQLAEDPDVDLVVSSTNVVLHKQTLLPSIRKGKAVFCEWPLGRNLAEAEELLDEVKRHNDGDVSRTVIGLQGRYSPVVKKLSEILSSGRVGKLQRTSFSAPAGYCGDEGLEEHEYFFRAADGGNLVSIFFLHLIESVLFGLGGREFTHFDVVLGGEGGEVQLKNRNGDVVRTIVRETHKSVAIQGVLDDGSELSLQLWGGKGAPGDKESTYWRVVGDKGEVRVRGTGPNLQMGGDEVSMSVLDYASGEVEEVALSVEELKPVQAGNVARLYAKFAEGQAGEYPNWEWAVKRHMLIDEMYKKNSARG
ncbi:hypothetical protein PgNI_10469 [Pyricularia grisea]|uniref:Uncharacterized protein n=1 Tax=Pyricularia grisea TaxID=148305 RepID=A0A6P8AZL0_PYRGI|nr:hypothetical protein PgNI_10469 [Pyricularia grisea]TLD07823.1 hypothetical protein PgNI_10469 [Pyricularia grisea]